MAGREKINNEHQKILSPADLYERDKVPGMFRPLAHFFLEHVRLEPGMRVLDLACGTGIVARIAAPRLGASGQVTGVDINPEMLRVAGENTPNGVSIIWKEGDASALPFEDGSFDWVVCQQGFQFFPDKPGALAEMHRVLAPGGGAAMLIWRAVTPENHPYQWAKVVAYKKHVSLEAGEKHRKQAPFFEGDRERLRVLLEGAGFRNVDVRDLFIVRQRGPLEVFVTEADFAELSPDVRAAVVQDVRAAMAPYVDSEGTAVPYGVHLVLAAK